jgi:cell division septation protein DedD
MSSNGRREGIKIVAPLTQSREAEIIGGLKNALDRGETLAKAKQSFINAGYKPAEINVAVQKMSTTTPQTVKPTPAPTETKSTKPQPTQEAQQKNQPTPTAATQIPKQKKPLSKKFLIILISSAALVFVGAAILGLFWDRIF